jgi:hypothetical protein
VFNFTIPADGSSVSVDDFAAAAKETLASISLADEEKDQAKAAVDAAISLVKAGHVGSDKVYVAIGLHANPSHTQDSIVSIGVYQRPAPPKPAAVVEEAEKPNWRIASYTGPLPEEIVREALATGESVKAVAERLGAPEAVTEAAIAAAPKAPEKKVAAPKPAKKAKPARKAKTYARVRKALVGPAIGKPRTGTAAKLGETVETKA